MSENCTAEDFAKASFARHWGGATARRARNGVWDSGTSGRRRTDAAMARDGWVPVVEATEVMQHRQIDAEAHLDQIGRLSKRLAAAGDQIESQRLVLEDLQEENDRLERILQAPLRMRDVQVAWEAAEVSDECNAGDVLISKAWKGADDFRVYSANAAKDLPPGLRILSRAPREPWQDLADVLGDFAIHDHDGKEYPDVLARRLYERGVRMVGGDDDE